MVSITKKYLFHDKTKFGLALASVSVSLLLMFAMTGLYFGFVHQATTYIDNSGASVWVASSGTPNFYFPGSPLPQVLAAKISQVDGVQTVGSLRYQGSIMSANGKNATVFYIGYNLASGLGGPWGAIDGHTVLTDSQVVIDSFLASNLGVHLGDIVNVNGVNLSVVGIMQGLTGFISYYVFVSLPEAQVLSSTPGTVNYFLVTVSSGNSPVTVAKRVQSSVGGVSTYTQSSWSQMSGHAVLSQLLPTVEGMLGIGALAATLIIGLTNYLTTVQRQREYGILKAVGLSNSTLLRSVLYQSLALALLSSLLGGILTVSSIYFEENVLRLLFPFVYNIPSFETILVASFATGIVAALVPAWRVARIDPAIAFRQ